MTIRAGRFIGAMLRPAYLPQKLTRPLVTKDGGTLRTVLDARAYMLALSKDREHSARWQRAAELLLTQADVTDFSTAVELHTDQPKPMRRTAPVAAARSAGGKARHAEVVLQMVAARQRTEELLRDTQLTRVTQDGAGIIQSPLAKPRRFAALSLVTPPALFRLEVKERAAPFFRVRPTRASAASASARPTTARAMAGWFQVGLVPPGSPPLSPHSVERVASLDLTATRRSA
jgi:hypothetical protein